MVLPSYVCWFINPMNTIVISTINHKTQPLISQLNAILGVPSCRGSSWLMGPLIDELNSHTSISSLVQLNEQLTPTISMIFPSPAVRLGNPPQRFTAVFDTGSGITWVPGSQCKSNSAACSLLVKKHGDFMGRMGFF